MKRFSFLKKRKVFIPLIAILVIGFFILRPGSAGKSEIETEVVRRGEVAQIVSETGSVRAAEEVELGFGSSGHIEDIFVEEGATVEKGEVLATLSGGGALIGVESARAQLRAARSLLAEMQAPAREVDRDVAEASVRSAEATLESTKDTQDQLVENAERQLFSSDLRAYLSEGAREDSDDSYVPPTITGTYTGDEEGEIRVELYSSSSPSGYSFRLSGLVRDVGSVSTVSPEPLGESGLFIQFPENFAHNHSLEWIIPIPNVRSATYAQTQSAYDAALRTRESAIAQAEAALELAEAQYDQALSPATTASIEAQEAAVLQAEAVLRQAETAYRNAVITAPFSGVVSDVSITEGEFASPSLPALSLMSDSELEITINIPESRVMLIEVGDSAEVTFDSDEETVLDGEVVHIAPRAETVDGVTVVPVVIGLEDPGESIRPGFTADVDIHTEKRSGVLVVPARSVVELDGQRYVRVSTGPGIESLELVQVETGLRGSDGSIEIVSGLEEGDVVVTFVPATLRERLEMLEEESSNAE